MYWDEAIETMPRENLEKLQLKRLQHTIKRLYAKVPFYQQRFSEAGIIPEDIQSLEDLNKLPFTIKKDLRDTYPFGMFAVPREELVRVHASSGTTGKPIVVGYTRDDLYMWSGLVARSITMAGGSSQDAIHISFGYGLFTGGMGMHYGAERLGAMVVPASGGNTAKQIMLIQDFKSTVLACTPSYALYLAETADKMGIDLAKSSLKIGIFGAEPWSENMRKRLEEKLGIKAYNIYGLSELMGPGVAAECICQNGMHIHEDNFIAEIIDPATGQPLPPGQKGELVLTSVTKEAFPVIRYRTRDLTSIIEEPCECGRTLRRINRIYGRSDDMLIIRGVNVFPSQVESVLLEFGEAQPYYLIVVDRKNNLDTLEIQVEVTDNFFNDKIRYISELEGRLKARLANILGISAKIKLVEPNTLPRTDGKSIRVQDNRKID